MLSFAFAAALGQHQGKARDESHLPLPIQHCTVAGGCKFENTSSVLDSNWRWTHEVGCTNSSKCNCFLGNVWVNETCKTPDECTTKCAIDGEDTKGYKEKYGISADGQGLLNLTFVTHYKAEGANGTNVGSRMYLLEDESNYKMFDLLNRRTYGFLHATHTTSLTPPASHPSQVQPAEQGVHVHDRHVEPAVRPQRRALLRRDARKGAVT